mmetsp:Transcript_2979/g.6441  ORF Transcript_2979/g.6441 Transcript_2979/m.6441 type:complete len:347 (+) Transcript_2979:985-2025(+)
MLPLTLPLAPTLPLPVATVRVLPARTVESSHRRFQLPSSDAFAAVRAPPSFLSAPGEDPAPLIPAAGGGWNRLPNEDLRRAVDDAETAIPSPPPAPSKLPQQLLLPPTLPGPLLLLPAMLPPHWDAMRFSRVSNRFLVGGSKLTAPVPFAPSVDRSLVPREGIDDGIDDGVPEDPSDASPANLRSLATCSGGMNRNLFWESGTSRRPRRSRSRSRPRSPLALPSRRSPSRPRLRSLSHSGLRLPSRDDRRRRSAVAEACDGAGGGPVRGAGRVAPPERGRARRGGRSDGSSRTSPSSSSRGGGGAGRSGGLSPSTARWGGRGSSDADAVAAVGAAGGTAMFSPRCC